MSENKQEPDETVLHSPMSYNNISGDEGPGFQTPTSVEHRIPESGRSSSPPPPPTKRKKVFVHKRKLPKLELLESTGEGKQKVDLFFQSFHPNAGSTAAIGKKIRSEG